MAKVRCQRIGRSAFFSEDDNLEDSCRYHDAPIFHDGIREWNCCKKGSHDFDLFLVIPGCKTGKRTTEKPVKTTRPAATPMDPIPAVSPASATTKSTRESCRLYMVKDAIKSVAPGPVESNNKAQGSSTLPKKIIDINQPQICKNKGCGQTFKEKDNHDTACSYHPGPAIFHDPVRGWKCCDIHVKELDEFVSILPCTKGWHNAEPTS